MSQTTTKKLVFFGNERLSSSPEYNGAPIFESLLETGYEIEALIIKNQPQKSRKPRKYRIIEQAQANRVPVISVSDQAELRRASLDLESDIAVLASFGLLVPKQVIDHFKSGIINVHPSLLPLYRGSTPIETTLLDDCQKTGVSLMRLGQNLDDGDIYKQVEIAILEQETKLSLTKRLASLASEMLSDSLDKIIRQDLIAKPQNHNLATYTKNLSQVETLNIADFESARSLSCFLRAYDGLSQAKLELNNYFVRPISFKSQTVQPHLVNKPKIIYSKAEKSICLIFKEDILRIDSLKPDNCNEMPASDFVNGFFKNIEKA